MRLGWLYQNSDGTLSLPKDPLFLQYHNFFKDLSQSVIDSYYIVSLVLAEMHANSKNQERNEVVDLIHYSVQEIFNQGGIKFMNSCVHDNLYNAFLRFSQLNVCDQTIYQTDSGDTHFYLNVPKEKQHELEKFI